MRGNYICLFSVIYINTEGENKEECGFCMADSFADAAHYLETKLYGSDLVEITHMELLDCCPVMSKDTWETLRKELHEG